ncbi:DapH/DapD/GlmU-related protein [Agarivorans sp. 1_MG-2023]|uniref:DapH/DapD/GlmU-related protein n=1 Tax=Agarivorans sp. 1_MG-2023 TaxID=3062634 RepID=UPI0026E16F95|nr:DapH/DapD/GlmU-related protein [Agarivorans sp. 1_MG-2023]MDO6765132.1 DapH/DapD/GlmU-related protein [Agarivorans sp. 1_MG-2023]
MAIVDPGNNLSSSPSVAASAKISSSQLGLWTEIGERCLLDNVMFGDYSYAQNDVDLALCDIGKFVSIASSVRINPSNHPWWRASLHHFSYRPQKYGMANSVDDEVFSWRADNKVSIGHDVWIGHGAIIMPGVNIGNGAIVGSGSVVTKDVPAWHIVVGNPAKVLRSRFEQADIGERLDKLAWWNWSHEQLAQALPLFQQDCLAFLEHYEQQAETV